VDMKKEVRVAVDAHGEEHGDGDDDDLAPAAAAAAVEGAQSLHWQVEEADADFQKVFIGRVPIMLQSAYCNLAEMTHSELEMVGECPLDQGGYFIINGSEKVLIAQERMANNHVYVFAKAQPATYTFSCEIRSMMERGSKVASTLFLKMMAPRVVCVPACFFACSL
jgi:DNA-directed RNA polymerase beta subunit